PDPGLALKGVTAGHGRTPPAARSAASRGHPGVTWIHVTTRGFVSGNPLDLARRREGALGLVPGLGSRQKSPIRNVCHCSVKAFRLRLLLFGGLPLSPRPRPISGAR